MTSALVKQLDGFDLTTAEIFYRMPDYPAILQTYVWQDWDMAPEFPVLEKFLELLAQRDRGAASLRQRLVSQAHRTEPLPNGPLRALPLRRPAARRSTG